MEMSMLEILMVCFLMVREDTPGQMELSIMDNGRKAKLPGEERYSGYQEPHMKVNSVEVSFMDLALFLELMALLIEDHGG